MFGRSWGVVAEKKMTGLLGGVLNGTTDGLFGWQMREGEGERCDK